MFIVLLKLISHFIYRMTLLKKNYYVVLVTSPFYLPGIASVFVEERLINDSYDRLSTL